MGQYLKKVCTLIIAVYSSIFLMSAAYHNVEQDGIYYCYHKNIGPGSYELAVVGFNPTLTGTVTIPSEVQGMKVSAIGWEDVIFSDWEEGYTHYPAYKIEKLIIPETINDIFFARNNFGFNTLIGFLGPSFSFGTDLLNDLKYCSEIVVDKDNPYYSDIDGVLFNKDLSDLIYCPKGKKGDYVVPEGTENIKYNAFCRCEFLTNIFIPNSVTLIEEGTFAYCTSLTDISISESITSISAGVFAYCSALTDIFVPESITSISDGAFAYCTSLTDISIPESITSIGKGAFAYCTSLTDISIPKYITSIEMYAFYSCESLPRIVLPDSVVTIGKYAFSCCYNLSDVKLPKSLTILDSGTFSDCKIKEIVLPEEIEIIESGVFVISRYNTSDNPVNLSKIILPKIIPPYASGAFSQWTYDNAELYVPADGIEYYRNDTPWNKFNNILTIEDVINIAFAEEQISIPKSESIHLSIAVTPANAVGDFVFSSSDETVAIVSEDGILTGVSEGEAIITVLCGNVSDSCKVKVIAPLVKDITFNPLTFSVGESVKMSANLLPEDAAVTTILWRSDAPEVAVVDGDGKVWFNGAGEATVTAECQGLTAAMTFRVEAVEAEELNVFPAEAVGAVGQSFYMLALHTPDNTTDKSVSWESSDPAVATVDEDGRIELLAQGQTTVTATSGTHTATATITVSDSTVGLVELAGNGVAIKVADGGIDVVNAPEMARVIVSGVDGRVVTAMYAESAELHIPLAAGVYIVKVGDAVTAKVLVK